MIPSPGQTVAITFRNGALLSGEVVSWSDAKSVIKSAAGTSLTVIQKTLDDVLFFKVHNAAEDYEKIKSKAPKNNDDIRALAELQGELKQIEREELAAKLTGHVIGEQKSGQYGLQHELFKVKNSTKHPREETPRENSVLGSELRNLFQKERSED